ncbi:TPA: hypothetical protein ACXDAY_002945 [Clostridium botulinum]|uniref:hypothetical protein n=2 Tax=Clostridium botulinum TaxID=1491 RepID=UPI00035BA5E1|nr:hypothetical protein [Clostridium botulinum]APH23937.1 hypothetical protein NPD1_3307 [Clostridium botulinum]APQ69001.1 hypothetical protein RSJ8_1433 [Clostridium botulinum]EPS56299.1 phage-like protein [Clostridium botulinum Af84]MBN3351857.1 hypothetical protein [Clostridium botulinum]MBN3359442.1 hypothetical protein [Clostridium botulinum]
MGKDIYIMSLEGADIYEHINREADLHKNYVGMIPYSLELRKLKIKIFDSKRYNKTLTNDIINVKFNKKVRSNTEVINILNKKIRQNKVQDVEGTKRFIEELKSKTEWQEIKNDDLRQKLYKAGFKLEFYKKDKKTKEYVLDETIKYVVYKRSSSKSRTGQVLFIKEELKEKMIKWARMGLEFENRSDIDYPSLLSYESLVSSSLEDTVKIPVENILLIDDVKSIFPVDVNVVEKDKKGLLVSRPQDDYKMENDIFDGEGLLDSQYFVSGREDKGMMLLRQHMFKCCVFNTNIQQFLKDNCPTDVDYNTWKLENMFGETILAKDIHLITTPNSLKALKFSKIKDSKQEMWEQWENIVKKEGNIFGICKSEKESKRGYDIEGNIINQTSYQMLNSMPISSTDMEKLSQFELDYIEKLKNNDDTYIEFLEKNANDMNCNEMLVDLCKKNNEITHTKLFKDKRKKDIHNYIKHVKKGKIRLQGDYCTIIQNGKELLYHAIGKLPVSDGILDCKEWEKEMILKDNEVYTTLHDFNEEYVGFRNPHTSPSNVLIVQNTDSDFVEKYFNLTDNIIYTNAINFEINRILSGQDVDSDSIVLFNSDVLLENAKECYKKYRVCINNVDTDLNKYKVTNTDMAKIDNILANSQRFIGEVVNLGQLYMSTYYDCINKGETDKNKLSTLIQGVDICTILSEISIDSAKRMYEIDIEQQIKELSKCKYLYENKPNFFKYVSQNKNIKNKVQKYETSMDHLQEILNNIEDAEERPTIDLLKFINNFDKKKVKWRQVTGITESINHMMNNIKYIETFMRSNTEDEKKEKYIAQDNTKNEHMQQIKRYKIKTETIYVIIQEVLHDRIECKYKTDLLNILYNLDKEKFLEVFKKQK